MPRRQISQVLSRRNSSANGHTLTVVNPGMLSSMLRGISAKPAPALTQASMPWYDSISKIFPGTAPSWENQRSKWCRYEQLERKV